MSERYWGMTLAMATVAVCAVAPWVGAQQAAQGDSGQNATRQAEIMARVLEDSLDGSGLEDWRGELTRMSPLEQAVRAEYVPTVGAIFTVRVGFLITEPPAQVKEKPETGGTEEDLWQLHSRQVEPFGGGAFGGAGMGGLGGGIVNRRVAVHSGGSGAGSGKGEVEVVVSPGGLPGGAAAGERRRTMRVPGVSADYDKAKVDTLRKTIIEALAKYGSRMDKVAESERLIVVVEAPSAAQSAMWGPAFGGIGGGAAGGMGGAVASPVQPPVSSADATSTASSAVASEWAPVSPPPATPFLAFTIFSGAGACDRWMLALPKSSLTQALAYDAVMGQVEEHRY